MRASGTLTLDIKPSLLGQGLVTLLAGAALATVFYIQPNLWVFVLAALVIGLTWAWFVQRFNKPRWRRVAVSLHSDQVVLSGLGKRHFAGTLKRCLLNSGLLIGLSVATEQGSVRAWLFPDNVDSTDWKRLRERLSNPAGSSGGS